MNPEYKGTVTARDESHWDNGYSNGLADCKEELKNLIPAIIEINSKDYLRSISNLLVDAMIILRKESEAYKSLSAAKKMLDVII